MTSTEAEIQELTEMFKESLFAITGNEYEIFIQIKSGVIRPQTIINMVSLKLNIPVEKMLGHSHKGVIQDANRVATYLIFQHCGLVLKDIAKVFNRDHSSIIVRRNRHEDLIITDKDYRRKFELCKL